MAAILESITISGCSAFRLSNTSSSLVMASSVLSIPSTCKSDDLSKFSGLNLQLRYQRNAVTSAVSKKARVVHQGEWLFVKLRDLPGFDLMDNCCVRPPVVQSDDQQKKKGKKKANPFSVDYGLNNGGGGGMLLVLSDPTGRDIGISYELGQELERMEFGITYLCTGDTFACKSISKKKLRTATDIEDVRREFEIMKHLPPHPNIVRLKDTYEDDVAVNLVMELCEGEELCDRIVARGHYTERAASVVTKMIVEVVHVCLLSSASFPIL
ncbi:hypothetical protein GIB67_009923 [Kingdonia uniflora]|uniref:Protein kinase domain-containing protein n=1 Tax=Kingdonia uniflora TaxID=39325 RepID=A0A7J7L4B3_9MAGN|nr:hypothetical protein GIB67_009923 [Kingdonia uniflora]